MPKYSGLAQHIFGRNITTKIINHETTLPAMQKVSCMLTGSAALVIKHDNRRTRVQIVAAITPQISPFGLASTWVKLLYRRLIGMEHLPLFEHLRQPIR